MTPHAMSTESMRARARDLGIVFFFAALFFVLSVSTNTFLQQDNLLNVLDQSSELLVVTAAITICIIAGIFDLSVASMATVAAITTCMGVNVAGWPGGIVAGLGAGACLGLVNGLAIGFTKVNSFIGTLATSFAFKGLAIVISGGSVVAIDDLDDRRVLSELFTGRFLGAKGVVFFALAFVVVLGIVLARTVFGRHVYAVGGNAEAARLAGVRVMKVQTLCFVLTGLAAGLAGIFYAGRYGSGASNSFADTFAFQAIAAAVVGGTSIFGGAGAVWRAVVGVLILALIGNGFNLLGIDPTYQLAVQGVLIFAAVAGDQYLRGGR
jgi:ribose transport system permease protein